MFIYKIPNVVKKLFSKLIWEIPNAIHQNENIYFTFDDGPTPEITKFVLDELNKSNAKATFFCIGKNIRENPDIIKAIIINGHAIGNHTMNHLNAWKVSETCYLENIKLCENEIQMFSNKSVGFRPPYGRISNLLNKSNLVKKIIMWSVLTGDYRKDDVTDDIIKNCLPLLKPGAIVVFHDSLKAYHNLKVILPVFLDHCRKNNLTPSVLPYD